MKRSEINKALKALEAMCAEYRFSPGGQGRQPVRLPRSAGG